MNRVLSPKQNETTVQRESGTTQPRERARAQATNLLHTSPRQVAQRALARVVDASPRQIAQRNRTGLPDALKSGVESLSGMSMDHVKVHYNSGRPAQLNALAYAQGSDIHIAPGQEKHLPHEAWHVVQQAQGRVKPTVQMAGTAINDARGLETEADHMGARALAGGSQTLRQASPLQFSGRPVAQLRNRTEIVYQAGVLNWYATHAGGVVHQTPVGLNTTAFIDPEDPERGERTGNNGGGIYTSGNYKKQNGNQSLTQGHLLNANLGGKAISANLFPITAVMNRAHSSRIEEHVKAMVVDLHQKRNLEHSLGAAQPVLAGVATARQRATDQVAVGAAIEAAAAVAGLPVAVSGAVRAAAGVAGANRHTVAIAAINAAAAEPLATAASVAAAANGIGPALGAPVAGMIAGVTAAAAAGMPGLAGTLSALARPEDISDAIATTPAAGLPAPGVAGAPQWNNARVFYNVRVAAPGINGGAAMRPVTLRNELFHCRAYLTTNDGVTRNNVGSSLDLAVRADDLNKKLAALQFHPTPGPMGLVVGPALAGAAAPNVPSRHNVLSAAGAVVGSATLFRHT